MPNLDEMGFSDEVDMSQHFGNHVQKANLRPDIRSSLTLLQDNVLSKYMGTSHHFLNTGLRAQYFGTEAPSGFESVDDYLSMVPVLDKLIADQPLSDTPERRYRGIKGSRAQHDLLTAEVGSAVQMRAYTSTSENAYISLGFTSDYTKVEEDMGEVDPVGEYEGKPVVMEFLTRQGLPVGGEEQEVLMPRNTTWRVAGRYVTTFQRTYLPSKEIVVVQLVDEEYLDELDKGQRTAPRAAE